MKNTIPHLETRNGRPLLIVDGKPFIMLAGETHNSSASSLEYMEAVWEKALALRLNTVLLPVSWELIEPEEGHFDFSLVKGVIDAARERGLRLGILWFGAWKNAQCYYAPAWVKTDLRRFRRAEIIKNRTFIHLENFYDMPYSSLSYLCEATREADAKAFAKLMAFLRDYDGERHTVITVQVENETGVMGAAREHSDEADDRFYESVPADFVNWMRAHTENMAEDVRREIEGGRISGNWSEVFGKASEEIFSAWHIASYVGYIAQAGKKEYPLPMTVNCWLNKPGEQPGDYPSGGPVSRMEEVWRFCAPEIDLHCPDIYVQNFTEVCEEYTRRGNALYIPECATHSYAAARALLCVGRYHAMCYSPFGFEDIGLPFSNAQMALFGADVDDPALSVPQDAERYGQMNRLLAGLIPKLTDAYGSEELQASSRELEETADFLFGDIVAHADFSANDGASLVLREGEFFYVLAQSSIIRFSSANPELPGLDILSLEEGCFENDQWQCGRRLNGDEAVVCAFDEPTLLRAKVFAF